MSEVVQFETIAGKRIFSIFSEPEKDSKKLVIMSHGFKGSSVGASRSFVNFAQLLVQNGFSVLRFDQPCSGNSEGDFVHSSFKDWVATIIYFSQKYLKQGYQVALLGHSMGADASLVAATSSELQYKIPVVCLWAPDPKSDQSEWFTKEAKLIDQNNQIYEENGQQFSASYWQEVLDADFFKCLREYNGNVHLVYGENDKFVQNEMKKRVITEVLNKGQEVMILEGQDHMAWEHEACTRVFNSELQILKKIQV